MSEFDKKRKGTGTKEWAETTFNIGNGCSHDCRYCYAAANALRFGMKGRRDDWANESFTANSEITTYPSRKGVVMFPSTHDVTPFYLPRFLRAALLMLDKGNKLLITTKPSRDIMDAMTAAFQGYGGQILFRVTIGAFDPDLTDFWEPGAPTPNERLRALSLAAERGFSTSVSCEPMLAGTDETLRVVRAALPFTQGDIWIGKMNRINLRVNQREAGVRKRCEDIFRLQSDPEIIRLYRLLEHTPQIRWKDSIREVLVNHAIIAPEA